MQCFSDLFTQKNVISDFTSFSSTFFLNTKTFYIYKKFELSLSFVSFVSIYVKELQGSAYFSERIEGEKESQMGRKFKSISA